MIKDLVVIGSGGIDIVQLIEDINAEKKTYNFLGFLEKDETKIGKEVLGYPILGNDDLLKTEFSKCAVVNNVMHTPQLHEKISERLHNEYKIFDTPSLVHPNVNLNRVEIGIGNIIFANSKLCAAVKIGDFNIFYTVITNHETIIGNYNLIATCTIGSRCKIGNYNLLGNGSVIANTVKIGNANNIAAGSVVLKNVGDNQNLMGYPAMDMMDFMRMNMVKREGKGRGGLKSSYFHHIGIAVKNLNETAVMYENAGYNRSSITIDNFQNVQICWLQKQGMPLIELLAPVDEKSPIVKTLEKNGVIPYHICYEVIDIEKSIAELRNEKYVLVSKTHEAPAMAEFGNGKVAFLYHKSVGLIELVELKK